MIKWWDKFDQNRFDQIKNFVEGKQIEAQTENQKFSTSASFESENQIAKFN